MTYSSFNKYNIWQEGELELSEKKFNRRKFLKAAIGSGLLIASGNLLSGCELTADIDKPPSYNTDNKIKDLDINYLRQIVTHDPATSRCIMWKTDDILRTPEVEVKISDSDEIKTFTAVDCSFTDDDHIINQYSAKIEGLEVNKNYEYRIVEGNHCSEWHLLKTSNNENFKALIFPDSQCGDYKVWENVAKDAFARNPDAAFFVNIGDLVDNGEDWTQWRSWFQGAADFLDKIICVPMLGNHECYNRQWQIRQPIAYLNYFDLPENGSEDFKRRYYSFDFGDVHFAIFDSQWYELDEVGGDGDKLINEQKEWLKRDISESQKKWKIVLTHKDVLQYRINGRPERLEGFSDVGIEFMPLFDELNVDIVFTGHLHTYRDRGHIYNFEHNPQGALYILTGNAGDVRYPGLWIDHELDLVKAPQPEIDNYLTMEVSSDKIIVKCFLYDGTEIDNVVVEKYSN